MSLLQRKTIPDEDDIEEIERSKKRHKSDEVVDNDTKASEESKFLRRWFEHDKPRMLYLLKNHNVAMYEYDFDHTDMEFYDDITNERTNLDGKVYDIMFVAGFRDDLSRSDYTDGRIMSRTVKNGTLTFLKKRILVEDQFYTPGTDVLYGRIDIEKSSCLPTPPLHDNSWEYTFQVHDTEFREYPQRIFGSDDTRSLTFSIMKHEKIRFNDEFGARFQIIANSGTLDWIPTEYEPVNNPIMLNNNETLLDPDSYKSYLRNQLLYRYSYNDKWWCTKSSWLCNYMNIPHGTAYKIYSYIIHTLPVPQWTYEKDDILIRLSMKDYNNIHFWTTEYIARPRRRQDENSFSSTSSDNNENNSEQDENNDDFESMSSNNNNDSDDESSY